MSMHEATRTYRSADSHSLYLGYIEDPSAGDDSDRRKSVNEESQAKAKRKKVLEKASGKPPALY
jgi:hypothetical protein